MSVEIQHILNCSCICDCSIDVGMSKNNSFLFGNLSSISNGHLGGVFSIFVYGVVRSMSLILRSKHHGNETQKSGLAN